jgi:Tfp pilus assembly protein PilE
MVERLLSGGLSGRNASGEFAPLNLLALFVIAGILTALLLPTYRSYTIHEHGKLAQAALEDVLEQRKSWVGVALGGHPASLEDLGYSSKSLYVSSDGTVRSSANINSIYRISLAFPTTPGADSCGLTTDVGSGGFVAVAEPVQTQRIDQQCARLCLSSDGQRGASGSAGVEQCWRLH